MPYDIEERTVRFHFAVVRHEAQSAEPIQKCQALCEPVQFAVKAMCTQIPRSSDH